MDKEEQFVNIDLNDDNICSVCKLETDTGTMSFCHVCFELSIEGVSHATLLHTKSLRGHRECFEKYHLIANQKLSRSKVSRSPYEGMKLALSQKISRIVQYAQNKDSVSSEGSPGRRGGKHQLLCYSQNGDRKLLPQSDAQVPRYTPRWNQGIGAGGLPDYATSMLECHSAEELGLLEDGRSLGALWGVTGRRGDLHRSHSQSSGGDHQTLHSINGHSRDECEFAFSLIYFTPLTIISLPHFLKHHRSDFLYSSVLQKCVLVHPPPPPHGLKALYWCSISVARWSLAERVHHYIARLLFSWFLSLYRLLVN
uniref:Protein EURL homolog n=1 Tax=Oncorhynchus kisutch TaxID=8019 RepID=A0A8C7J0I7_ONCKI